MQVSGTVRRPGTICPRQLTRCALCAVTLLCSGLAMALDWSALSASQRELLAPWQRYWTELPVEQRSELRDNASAWLAMTPTERDAMQARLATWQDTDPLQRARLRERFAAYQRLDPRTRHELRRRYERFHTLPAGQRSALRARFGELDAHERRALLVGAQQREALQLARELWAFVPADETEPTLELLQQLAPSQRAQLRERTRHMPPWQREQLRRELLDGNARERVALLAAGE